MKNIIKIAKDQEVSSDFIGDEHSCIVDANSSLQLNPKFFKLICWYENEYSYACRVVDSIKYSEENKYKLTASFVIPSIKSIPTKPIQNFNKEYIVSNCHISGKPKLMLSSQETEFKTEKPLEVSGFKQFILRDSKQNKDISLARNDGTDIAVSRLLVKENKIFNYLKTKERLEEVKKEFSKMANMTEKLLKKSNQNKCEANSLGEELYSDKDKKDSKRKLDSTRLSLPAVIKSIRTNEFAQKCIGDKDAFNAHKTEVSNTITIKNNSDYSNTPKVNANRNQQLQNKSNVFGNLKILKNPRQICQHEEASKITEAVDDQKNLKPEDTAWIPIKTCADSLYNNRINQVTDSNAHKSDLWKFDLCTKKIVNHDIRHTKVMELEVTKNKLNDKSIISRSEKICNNNITKNEEIKQKNSIENNQDVTSSDSNNEKFNNVLIKYDINNLNRTQNLPDVISSKSNNKDKMKTSNESNLNRKKLTVTCIKPESSELKNDDVATLSVSRNEIRKKILVGIMKILAAKALENKTRTPSLVTTNTTTSNREVCKSLDIYDKLESASASDSDNSFQINEKTSQVLDVMDLSSSAEELARLDKICRIIEISDEMSDKLFSALNDDENNTKKTKWSFKDLCERLKFDEFCNNVFGEPSSLD